MGPQPKLETVVKVLVAGNGHRKVVERGKVGYLVAIDGISFHPGSRCCQEFYAKVVDVIRRLSITTPLVVETQEHRTSFRRRHFAHCYGSRYEFVGKSGGARFVRIVGRTQRGQAVEDRDIQRRRIHTHSVRDVYGIAVKPQSVGIPGRNSRKVVPEG